MIFSFVHQRTNKLCRLTIQQSILKDFYNANYFNNGFVQLQGVSYYKQNKKASHSVQVNHGKTFQILSRTYKQNSGTFQDSKKKNRTFQDVATLFKATYFLADSNVSFVEGTDDFIEVSMLVDKLACTAPLL